MVRCPQGRCRLAREAILTLPPSIPKIETHRLKFGSGSTDIDRTSIASCSRSTARSCMSFTFGTVAAGPRAGCERLPKNCDVKCDVSLLAVVGDFQ